MARPKNSKKAGGRKRQRTSAAEAGFRPVAMPLLDLAAIEAADPSALVALRRFEDLQDQRTATEADFLDVVKLLHRVGCPTEAEYFLRSSLLVLGEDEQSIYEDADGLALYLELFGTAKQEEFAAAIAAFSKQFSAKLTKGAGSTFEVGYHTVPRSACLSKYRMQNEPCYVRFEYDHRTNLDVWLESQTSGDQLVVMRWVNRVWEVIGTGMSTRVDEGGRRRRKRAT